MKIIFDVNHSFAWAHGGIQVLVEHLTAKLPEIGVEVEPLRWWDSAQRGDLLHTFYMPVAATGFAKKTGMKLVSNVFVDYLVSNSLPKLFAKKQVAGFCRRFFKNYAADLGWLFPEMCDAYVYASVHEARIAGRVFGATLQKSHVILHGVDDCYFASDTDASSRSDYLISVSTIHPRKNSVLLARLAHETRVPMVFVGKPYSEDLYFQEFMTLVDDRYVIYKGYVGEDEKLKLLKSSRGFASLSWAESGCIAVLEAFASGNRVFLPDLPWARSIYDGYAYFGNLRNKRVLADQFHKFYFSPGKELGRFPVSTWNTVANEYRAVYEAVLS